MATRRPAATGSPAPARSIGLQGQTSVLSSDLPRELTSTQGLWGRKPGPEPPRSFFKPFSWTGSSFPHWVNHSVAPRWLICKKQVLRPLKLQGPKEVVPNQSWVRSPTRSKANLLTAACGEEKCSTYCKAIR